MYTILFFSYAEMWLNCMASGDIVETTPDGKGYFIAKENLTALTGPAAAGPIFNRMVPIFAEGYKETVTLIKEEKAGEKADEKMLKEEAKEFSEEHSHHHGHGHHENVGHEHNHEHQHGHHGEGPEAHRLLVKTFDGGRHRWRHPSINGCAFDTLYQIFSVIAFWIAPRVRYNQLTRQMSDQWPADFIFP